MKWFRGLKKFGFGNHLHRVIFKRRAKFKVESSRIQSPFLVLLPEMPEKEIYSTVFSTALVFHVLDTTSKWRQWFLGWFHYCLCGHWHDDGDEFDVAAENCSWDPSVDRESLLSSVNLRWDVDAFPEGWTDVQTNIGVGTVFHGCPHFRKYLGNPMNPGCWNSF